MKTHITFYRAKLCPRCHIARRHLKELTKTNPSIEIEEVDILLTPRRV